MKKVILLAACTAAVLLSGCSDNELASVGDGIGTSTQSAIGFHVVGYQAETRANIINPGNITSTSFNVYAFTDDGKAFMGTNDTKPGHNGINISYKGVEGSKKWDYTNPTDLRYWPETGTPLNFYAVCPANLPLFFSWQISKEKKDIQYASYDEYKKMEKDEQNGVSPRCVSKVVLRVINKKKTPLVKTVGGSYKLVCGLVKVLPVSLASAIIKKIYG